MPDHIELAERIANTADWNRRVALIRRIPEDFGTAAQPAVYAAVAQRAYSSSVEAEIAYIHWRDDYELDAVQAAYDTAHKATGGFVRVDATSLQDAILSSPQTLRIFRLLLGFTVPEFAEACALIAKRDSLAKVTRSAVIAIERGTRPNQPIARTCATAIHATMTRTLVPPKSPNSRLRLKLDKPDTATAWESVRKFAAEGVPLSVLLHQRAYGGAFRQLLDATSSARGDLLEEPVEEIFVSQHIPFLRTGPHNQADIQDRFGLTVRPAPDFVVFDSRSGELRAILECKVANDGGTARDKAARFRSLRVEANRLGGVPLFAVLAGLGWRRTADALGPVVRDTDGRTFAVATLTSMLETEPFPGLVGLAP